MEITELEFSQTGDDLEISYLDENEEYCEKVLSVEDIEHWAMRTTNFFKGSDEEMIGPDHTGEPVFQKVSWEYGAFDELPYDWKIDLITQFLNK